MSKRLSKEDIRLCHQAFEQINYENPERIKLFDLKVALKCVDRAITTKINDYDIFR